MKYVLREVKTFRNLSGPDQKIKWSAIAIKQNFSSNISRDMSRIDLVSKNLLANCFHDFGKRNN